MWFSLILHFDIYRGGLQFPRISTVVQKYFDALHCFTHDIHATLSRNCKYILFNPNIPCLHIILANSIQKYYFTLCLTSGFAIHPNQKYYQNICNYLCFSTKFVRHSSIAIRFSTFCRHILHI